MYEQLVDLEMDKFKLMMVSLHKINPHCISRSSLVVLLLKDFFHTSNSS